MADTIFRGPAISLGALMGAMGGAGALACNIEPWDGPAISYQGDSLPDVRYAPSNKDGMGVGRIPGLVNNPYFVLVDQTPAAVSTTGLAAAQAPTAATPLTLVTVAAGGGGSGQPSAAFVPLIPQPAQTGNSFPNSGSVPISVLAIDFGFTTGNLTAGTASIPVPDSTLFQLGQWIVIGGAGNSSKTAALVTQVTGIADATHISVTPAPLGTLNNAPIGNANFNGPFPSNGAASAVNPYYEAGVLAALNPAECVCRVVSITGNAGSSANNVTVKGYDLYGMPMTETIAFAGGATTKFGQKAFKYIASITPATTDGSHTLAAGWGDVFGFAIRSDKWEYMNIFYNGSFATTNSGWLARDLTNPATASTGDVRGTVQTSANGNGGTPSAPLNTPTTGSIRLTVFLTVPLWNLINATPLNPVPMFGQKQF